MLNTRGTTFENIPETWSYTACSSRCSPGRQISRIAGMRVMAPSIPFSQAVM